MLSTEDIVVDYEHKSNAGFSTIGESDFMLPGDVTIPDKFYKRIRSGHANLDSFFGGDIPGVIQGAVINVSASKGSGKSTLLSQLCSGYNSHNLEQIAAYITNEESVEQATFRLRRTGVSNVPVAKMHDIKDIIKVMQSKRFKVLVIDAFSNIEAGNLKGQKASDYCLQKIMEGCHKTNTTVFNVLHMTKGGKTKGSSNIGHAADIDCHIYRGNPDVWASSSVRIISTFGHKNRFAPETQLAFNMTGAGWDLDDVIANEFEIMAEKKPYLK